MLSYLSYVIMLYITFAVILINEKTCSSIISILAESLSHDDSIHLDMCASFASQLAASLCSDDKYKGVDELLLSLFVLNCNVQVK